MPTPKKSPPKTGKAAADAINLQQRELQEQENEIQAKIAALQRKIDEAPERAAEQLKRSREVLFAASPRKYLLGASTLDTRHLEAAAAAGRVPSRKARKKPAVLRAERRAAWVQTLAILAALAFAICWVVSHPPDLALLLKWLHLN